jgi:hypothetical protein
MRPTAFSALCLAAALSLSACGGGTDFTPPNRPPVANAGPAQSVAAGATVTLSGSGTDPDADVLAYAWTFSKPAGSSAALTNAHVASTTFVADLPGVYTATLTVSDKSLDSAPSTVTVTALPRLQAE